ncbi:hypothetical protein DFP72DRAFT_296187 [Ephemerocybe angulata]|uniref:Uncharacterized protein n=1 Tax=Ephemerocybe angulata TaxID=980116 RepID=A0A8H6I1L8_9AGAR|nr:hypothetical protein DFP72DRAFT_296187 [Tulosesus angulatus]
MIMSVPESIQARGVVYVYNNSPKRRWIAWVIAGVIILVIALLFICSTNRVQRWFEERRRRRAAPPPLDTTPSLLAPQFQSSEASISHTPPPAYEPGPPTETKQGTAPAYPAPIHGGAWNSPLAPPPLPPAYRGVGNRLSGSFMAVGDWIRRTRQPAANREPDQETGEIEHAPLLKS